MTKYRWFLVSAFAVAWTWAAWAPLYRADWFLENLLVFIFIPILLMVGRRFQLSDVSYTLLAIFMILHVVGSHYTYAEVPFGYTLQDWLDASRNMYDRLVHFLFGFLLAYPVREIFMRLAKVRGLWSYLLPIELTFALSAIYEIVEWLTAVTVDAAAGIAFLGTQGDIWDAQKDMLLAGVGAIIAMGVVAFINWKYKKDFWEDLDKSVTLPKNDEPLGEVKLAEMMKK